MHCIEVLQMQFTIQYIIMHACLPLKKLHISSQFMENLALRKKTCAKNVNKAIYFRVRLIYVCEESILIFD